MDALFESLKAMMSEIQFWLKLLGPALIVLILFCGLIAAFHWLTRKTFDSW